MKAYWRLLGLGLTLSLGSTLTITTANNALAQNITLDGTLGSAQTLNGPVYTIPQAAGQTVGSNLFHSFGRFNLFTGERANFQSVTNIRNIFSRVTGGSPSQINGLIFTNSLNVNLFLINPSGIVFGPNARLDVGGSTRGSFVATTANALVWSNSSQFSATNPGGANSLLTIVGDPTGFLFNSRPPQPIQTFGSRLRVYEGQSLLLLGGDVSLDSFFLNSFLFVRSIEGGRIELGAVAEPGTVGLNTNGNILSLNFPENLALADVSLTNGSILRATAGNGGSIAINARNIDILARSQLLAGIDSGLGDVNSQAGNVTLNATGEINIRNSLIRNLLGFNSVGQGGNININTGSLTVAANSQLNSSNAGGRGQAGNINIKARDNVLFDGGVAFSRLESGGVGKGGDIFIDTNSLTVTGIPPTRNGNTGQLTTATFGDGDAGNVIINARGAVIFDGRGSDIFTLVGQANPVGGNAGNIIVNADSLEVKNSARLISQTEARGNAGDIEINARKISLTNGGLLSSANSGTGNVVGGNIRVMSNIFEASSGGGLFSFTSGESKAGDITVTASDSFRLTDPGTGLFANTGRGTGRGGEILVNTNNFQIANNASLNATTEGVGAGGSIRVIAKTFDASSGGQLLTSTSGNGQAGNITVSVNDSFNVKGTNTGLFANTSFSSTLGQGGDIEISARNIFLTDGGRISAASFGNGNAGKININGQQVLLNNGAEVAASNISGESQNITLSGLNSLVVLDNSQITASTNTGRAGNLRIDAAESVLVSGDSNLSVEATGGGTAGNLTVNTGQFNISDNSRVSVSSPQGQAGNLEIAANSLFLNGGSITSETGTGQQEGGNIRLNILKTLLLRNESLISATANGRANGGNININTQFLIALPPTGSKGSDIIANAEFGTGGTINVNAEAVFGIEFQLQQTAANDFTASSEFGSQGEVQINSLAEPNSSIAELPENLVDASGLIAQNACQKSSDSEFSIIGRGGLPPTPNETLSSDVVWSDTRFTTFPTKADTPRKLTQVKNFVPTVEVVAISPATGWVLDNQGNVMLVSHTPKATAPAFQSYSTSCPQG